MKEISEPRYSGKQNKRDGDQLYHLTLDRLFVRDEDTIICEERLLVLIRVNLALIHFEAGQKFDVALLAADAALFDAPLFL